MKKYLTILLASLCLMCFCGGPVFAVEPYEYIDADICDSLDPSVANYDMFCEKKGQDDLIGVVGNVLNTVYFWVGILAVIFIIIGGVKYMTSQGDPGKVAVGKNTLKYSIIGLVVALSAFGITQFVLISMNGGTTPSTPTPAETVEVTSLEIISSGPILEGESLQIKVRIVPSRAEDRTLTFSSSNESIATVSESGLITTHKDGKVTITATSANGVSTSRDFTVEKLILVESIKLEPGTATIIVGKTVNINATVYPANARDKKLTWTSSNNSIATVNGSGLVTGKKEGKVTITATATNGVKATATVTVEPKERKFPALQEIRSYTSGGFTEKYWLNVPEGAKEKMPLIMFFHGDGEATDSTESLKNYVMVKAMFKSKDFIAIAPHTQVRYDQWNSSKMSTVTTAIKGVIDKVSSEYKIDTKRIYVMGHSRGAIITWNMVNKYPTLFAAAAPISCGGGGISYSNFKSTKISAFAGNVGGDEQSYNSQMRSMVNSINASGGSATMHVFNGYSHGQTPSAIVNHVDGVDLFSWFLKQSR